jgi:hypothetical protein
MKLYLAIAVGIMIIITGLGGYWIGYDSGRIEEKVSAGNITPQVVEVEKIVYQDRVVVERIPVEVIKEVVKVVTQNITTEKIVYQTVYTGNLTKFGTIQEVRNWLNTWKYKPNQDWFSTAPGVLDFNAQSNDCDKYMLQMITDGVKDGYFFGMVADNLNHHALVFTLVGNDLHFIEPQTKALFKVLDGNYWGLDK